MNVDSNNFLSDLVILLREKASEVKSGCATGNDYEKGRLFAYYEVLSLIHQQAQAFGIDLNKIGMTNFNPDQDVL